MGTFSGLGNPLQHQGLATLSRTSNTITENSKGISKGVNNSISTVDGLVANAAMDRCTISKAIRGSIAQTNSLLNSTSDHLSHIADRLRSGLELVSGAGGLSGTARETINQEFQNTAVVSVQRDINSAEYGGKKILKGDLNGVVVSTGVSITDHTELSLKNFEGNKLFRSSLTSALNDILTERIGTGWAENRGINGDMVIKNENIIHKIIANDGNNEYRIEHGALGELLHEAIQKKPELGDLLDVVADRGRNELGKSFKDASIDEITQLYAELPNRNQINNNNDNQNQINDDDNNLGGNQNNNAPHLADFVNELDEDTTPAEQRLHELVLILRDGSVLDISNPKMEGLRVLASDVMSNAIRVVRQEQASVANKKEDLENASESLDRSEQQLKADADAVLKPNIMEKMQESSEAMLTRAVVQAMMQACQQQASNMVRASGQLLTSSAA